MRCTIRMLAASLLLLSHPAWAVKWGAIHVGVDENSFYFNVVITDIPPEVTESEFRMYTKASVIGSIPDDQEQFMVDVNVLVGEVLDGPRVESIGIPDTDHWMDEAVPEFSLMKIAEGSWQFIGSIPHGDTPYQPGDQLGEIRFNHSGGVLLWTGFLIAAQPPPSLSMTKTSKTRLATTAGQVVTYVYEIRNTGQVTLHDVALSDDNVDATPFCDYDGNDELTVAPHPAFTVTCSARHTVTMEESEANETLDNIATVTSDEAETVMTSLSIPFALFSNGFENPLNIITVLDDSPTVGAFSSIALGLDGNPVISYEDHSPAGALKVAKCNNPTCTTATITTVDDAGDVGGGSSIAVGNDGLPMISYIDQTNGALKFVKCNDPACTGGDETISVIDAPENGVGGESSIAIGNDGLPVISYQGREPTGIKVAKCNDAACSGGDEIITLINEDGGLHSSIAIGSDGFPVISFHQFINPFNASLVKVAKCNDNACTGGDETITIVAETGSIITGNTSISIGTDDLPVLAYFDSLTSSIYVATCNDAACSGNDETINAVDSIAFTGRQSLAIGADGFPVVSYRDNSSEALKVAKCNDATCSDGNVLTSIVDDLHSLARNNSIAIGMDGQPVVCYNRDSSLAIKVVHCGTPSCQ